MVNNEQIIWSYLLSKIRNAYGVAGLMGNLYAESALRPTNLQNTFEKKLGYTDSTYTTAVDNGIYKNFVNDSAGYGLAQWTFHTRKANLLAFAKANGKSIGDLEMQLDFLWKELSEDYRKVVNVLKTAMNVREASDVVLKRYESPSDQSEKVKALRASYGQAYYDKYAAAKQETKQEVKQEEVEANVPDFKIINMPAHPTNQWDRYGTKFEYIVLHYVGAVSTARNNGTYYGREANLGASAHFFVDENDIVASVPLTMAAGHCGVDYSGGKAPFWNGQGTYSTNRRSIGIEMCCKKDKNGKWYIEPETVTKTVALVKWLMKEYNIGIDHVIRHYDVCWKTCPEPWVRDPSQWKAFKARLTAPEKTVEEDDDVKRYKTVCELPAIYQKDAQILVDKNIIRGRGGKEGLDVTEDMVRVAIWFGRMEGILE